MPITQAFYTGVTGLSVMGESMSVVANNLANANAKGFKYDRVEFDDLMSLDLNTMGGQVQIGRGARLSDIRTMHTQGGLSVTERLTDLAIQGNGFFVLKDPASASQEGSDLAFTRVGSFNFDKDGYITDKKGIRLQGYDVTPGGGLSTKLDDIKIVTNNLAPVATKKITLNVNLDSRADYVEEEFDVTRPSETSNFESTVNIFDSHGSKHSVTTYFRRVKMDEGLGWEWHALVDGEEVTDADGEKYKEIATGKLTFNSSGMLLTEEQTFSSANFRNEAQPDQQIEFDFGQNIMTEEGTGMGASSSIASSSNTIFHSQNGYEAGNIKSLIIDLGGKIKGYYTNGMERVLGAFSLATFENVDGLRKAGENTYYSTFDSGAPKIGLAETGTRGSIYASSLEESNVDIAAQFVEMIRTQRGFQANSRSITTTDSMVEEVVNMKR
jgi:flagellar hook protein FlgE